MVRLRNIKKNDYIIESDILTEDSQKLGHVIVDIKSGELKEFDLPEGYEWCTNHVNHAKDKLIEMSKQNSFPEEKLIMWC